MIIAAIVLLVFVAFMVRPDTAQADCIYYSDYIHWTATVDIEGDAEKIVEDVLLSGNYAYLACGDSGLQVVDISDPDNPELIFTTTTPGEALGLALDSPDLYVADGSGLTIFDVSTAATPVQVGHVDMPGNAVAVTLAPGGNVAVVVGSSPLFRLVNVANSANPVMMSNPVGAPGVGHDVWVEGTIAYVTDSWQGLQVIDYSNYSAAYIMSSLALTGKGHGIFVRDGYAWVTGQDALYVIDISNPSIPSLFNSVALPGLGVDICFLRSMNPNGYYAFVAMDNESMLVFDVEEEDNPQQICTVSVPNAAGCITTESNMLNWNYIFVGGQEQGLCIIDKGNLSNPPMVGGLNLGYYVLDLAVRDSYAYLGGGGDLQLVDVADAESPQVLGTIPGSDFPMDLKLTGARLYVADYNLGLKIFDVGSPESPTLLGAVMDPSITFYVVEVSGSYAYVIDRYGTPGMYVFDVSDPTNIDTLGSVIDAQQGWRDLAVVGNHVYATGSGIRVIDVSDPEGPYVVTHMGPAWHSMGIDVLGDRAYIAYYDYVDSGGWLKIYDISNPVSPLELGRIRTPVACKKVTALGNYAFVSTRLGIHVFDISDSVNPQSVGYVATPANFGSAVYLSGSYLYIANGAADLQIMPLPCGMGVTGVVDTPSATSVSLTAYPNPFNPRTTFSYDLPIASQVDLAVYDLTGRLVKTLMAAEMHTAGRFEAVWTGADDSGRPVASGVYLVKLMAGGHRESTRITLVR